MNPLQTFCPRFTPLRGDLYRLHRRPGHPHVVLNDDYQGAQVIDPWTGSLIAQTSFGGLFRLQGGAVACWCLKADGQEALALPAEGDTACLMPLVPGGRGRDLSLPPGFSAPHYAWDAEGLVMADAPNLGYQTLDAEGALIPTSSLQVRRARPGWRGALHRLLGDGDGSVARVYAEGRALVGFKTSAEGVRGVIASWDDELLQITATRPSMDDVAALPGMIATLEEGAVRAYAHGQPEGLTLIEPPQNFELRAIELLPPTDQTPGALVCLMSDRLGTPEHQLLLYPLGALPAPPPGAEVEEIRGRSRAAVAWGAREAASRLQRADGIIELRISNTANPAFHAQTQALAALLTEASDDGALDGVAEVHVTNLHGTAVLTPAMW